MKFILGKKKEMTQIFKETGEVVPVTVVEAGPCTITQIKTEDKDKYKSVQVGFEKKKKISKPLKGHLKDLDQFRYLKEFRIKEGEYKRGDKVDVSVFEKGEKIKITGTSKGRGFTGVVKRWGFSGSPKTHGHKDQLRMPGSIGATAPARVFKGTRMGGRMGGKQFTVSNLEIIDINKDKNLLYIKGAIPGARNGLLKIKTV